MAPCRSVLGTMLHALISDQDVAVVQARSVQSMHSSTAAGRDRRVQQQCYTVKVSGAVIIIIIEAVPGYQQINLQHPTIMSNFFNI